MRVRRRQGGLVASTELSHHVGLDLLHGVLIASFVGDIHLAIGIEAGFFLWWAVTSVVPAATSTAAIPTIIVVVVAATVASTVIAIIVVVSSSVVVVVVSVTSAAATVVVVVIVVTAVSSAAVIVVIIVVEVGIVVVDVHVLHFSSGDACTLIIGLLFIAIPVVTGVSCVLSSSELIWVTTPRVLRVVAAGPAVVAVVIIVVSVRRVVVVVIIVATVVGSLSIVGVAPLTLRCA